MHTITPTDIETTKTSPARRVAPWLLVAAIAVALVAWQRSTQSDSTLRCDGGVATEMFGRDTAFNPPLRPTPEEALAAFFTEYPTSSSQRLPSLPTGSPRAEDRTASRVTYVYGHEAAVLVVVDGSTGSDLGGRPLGGPGDPWGVAQITYCT